MIGMSTTYRAMLKDKEYDVTPHIILILSLTLTQNERGVGERLRGVSVDMVGEECEVYCEDGRRSGPWVGAR